jgi:YfiH family protein
MSLLSHESGLNLIQPNWPDLPVNVRAFSTTRLGGVSGAPYDDGVGGGGLNLGDHVGDDIARVSQNRALLNALLPSDVTFLSQIHGNIAVDASNLNSQSSVSNAANVAIAAVEADACYTQTKDVVCAVLTADCLPILLASLDGRFVAAVHAGWRGLAGEIIENTVQILREQGAVELTAWLGPAIGPSAFEVGEDVYLAFSKKVVQLDRFMKTRPMLTGKTQKYDMDIYGIARDILNQHGVQRVHGGEYCTVSQPELFYSYRRDGCTGRMANLIWKS